MIRTGNKSNKLVHQCACLECAAKHPRRGWHLYCEYVRRFEGATRRLSTRFLCGICDPTFAYEPRLRPLNGHSRRNVAIKTTLSFIIHSKFDLSKFFKLKVQLGRASYRPIKSASAVSILPQTPKRHGPHTRSLLVDS